MTQPDTLHTRLEAEIRRRLEVARAAARLSGSESWKADRLAVMAGDVLLLQPNAWFGPDRIVTHIALHDPADAVRRYEGELEVLERHEPCTDTVWCSGGDCHRCREFHPCPEIRSLAGRLGVSVDA